VNFVLLKLFDLQRVLKLSFPLANMIASFEDALELFIVIYLFSLRESGRLFA
jgi:hypothetical protein